MYFYLNVNIFFHFHLDPAYPFINGPLRMMDVKLLGNEEGKIKFESQKKNQFTCGGDSGSGIQMEYSNGINIIIGVCVSGNPFPGSRCTETSFAANVTQNIEWIEDIALKDF